MKLFLPILVLHIQKSISTKSDTEFMWYYKPLGGGGELYFGPNRCFTQNSNRFSRFKKWVSS